MTSLLPALAGANIIYGLGMLELGMTLDFAQLVIDNEIALMVKKAVGGISVTDDDLAVDVIKEVGAAGEFISHKHTRNHFKGYQSSSDLIDRRMRGAWISDAKDLTEKAYEKAIDILENHKPDPLPDGAAETIRDIVDDATKEAEKAK